MFRDRTMRGATSLTLVLLSALVSLCLLPTASTAAGIGLRYVGCVANGYAQCADPGSQSRSLRYSHLYMSPDGRSAYGLGSLKVAISYARSDSGMLSLAGCLTSWPSENPGCHPEETAPLGGPYVGVNPDGVHVYQAGHIVAVSTYVRKNDGALAFTACLAVHGKLGCDGKVNAPINAVDVIGVAPRGHRVYVGFDSVGAKGGIAVFRQPKHGPLVFDYCISSTVSRCRHVPVGNVDSVGGFAFSPDGRTVFTRNLEQINVFRLGRNGRLNFVSCVGTVRNGDRRCSRPSGSLNEIVGTYVSPGNHFLHVTSGNKKGSVSTFKIRKNGNLRFIGCVGFHGLQGCRAAPGDHMFDPYQTTMSPDGRALFMTLSLGESVERYDLSRQGKLTYHGCMSIVAKADCEVSGAPIQNLQLDAISPDNESYYFGTGGAWSIFSSVPEQTGRMGDTARR